MTRPFLKCLTYRWLWLLAAGALAACSPATPVGPRAITFSGLTWTVKSSTAPVGPGPNYFSDSPENVWVDGGGALHLKIAQRDGKWYSSEVIANTPLVYGKYTWAVASPLAGFDPYVVLGLFSWDDGAQPEHHREMDIEVSRWGVKDGPNMQYAVQPYNTPGHRRQFTLPLTSGSTHSFDWSPERVQFDSWEGSRHEAWTFADRAAIPPAGAGHPRINLWMFLGKHPAGGKDIEVVIQSFTLKSPAR